jgi:hypothetical protein
MFSGTARFRFLGSLAWFYAGLSRSKNSTVLSGEELCLLPQ